MTYFVCPQRNDIFKDIWGKIETPHEIIYLPDATPNKYIRKFAHLLWEMGVLIKWNYYPESFYLNLMRIGNDDDVILYTYYPEPILNLLPFFKDRTHVYLWIWDSFDKLGILRRYLPLIKKQNKPIFTFDKEDSLALGLRFIPQMYPFRLIDKEKRKMKVPDIKYDCFYLGKQYDKDREQLVTELEKILANNGITSRFYLVDGKETKYISYKENIAYVLSSRCIIEFVMKGQSGLTIRTMESLAYEKKLITNNKHIIDYDFYHPDNIFILGIDDLGKIGDFINKPYRLVPRSIVEEYDVNEWIKKITG